MHPTVPGRNMSVINGVVYCLAFHQFHQETDENKPNKFTDLNSISSSAFHLYNAIYRDTNI